MTRPLSLVLLLASCTQNADVADSGSVLGTALEDAADGYGVPRDLLAAIAYTESHLDNRGGDEDRFGHVGVMGLRTDVSHDLGPKLWEAADALGADPADVQGDVSLQIAGSAALLRSWALEDLGEVPERVEDWWPIVERWSGVEDPALASSYATEVYQLIEAGFVHRTPAGERVELAGRYVPGLYSYDYRVSSDYAGAAAFRAAATCNYTDSGARSVDTVVIHVVQGSYAGCISWFQNCSAGASAHYVVRSSDGEVTQMIDEDDIGWHAGNWTYNQRSIGIEHEGYVDQPSWFTDAMYRSSADLVRDICDRHGIPKDRAHIIGHNEVPDPDGSGWGGAGNHTDPGSYWDWDKFMALVGETAPVEVAAPTGDLTGYVRQNDIYSGPAIANAKVALNDGRTATTDGAGRYTFYALPEGTWTVNVSAGGYGSAADSKYVRPDTLNWKSVALVPTSSSAPTSTAPEPPALPGKPHGLTPNGTYETGDAVTMVWSDDGPASTLHELEMWWWDGAAWQYYYTWTPARADKTYWPYVRGTVYAYAVRGKNDAGWGEWSDWAYFEVSP